MYKAVIAGAIVLLGSFGGQSAKVDEPFFRLKEEAMFVEYSATENTAVVTVEAESEQGLGRVEIRNLRGTRVLEMAVGVGQTFAVSGFVVESQETSCASLFGIYAEGIYDLRARAVDGRLALGRAVLSHTVPPAPIVTYPHEGGVNVPTDLTVSWTPDPEAFGYRLVMEQGENDGLSVHLPAGTDSFRIPEHVLAPGTESHVEVAAIGRNGNRTLVHVNFTTL